MEMIRNYKITEYLNFYNNNGLKIILSLLEEAIACVCLFMTKLMNYT